MLWEEEGFTLYLPHGQASEEQEARYFVRFPQENQSAAALYQHLQDPEMLLAEARDFWSNWKPFGATAWTYPSQRQGEFLTVCARNIQQAREVKNGHLVFQVGPTVYRGLWIVDGNFILEAARYLGYDHAADEGLRSEWSKQVDSGQIIAAGGGQHWKDTAIAMFTLVRQCELKQDWTLFRDLEPKSRVLWISSSDCATRLDPNRTPMDVMVYSRPVSPTAALVVSAPNSPIPFGRWPHSAPSRALPIL